MRYGDVDSVKKDVEMLNDILSRQGSELLIDVIAENVGKTALKYKLNNAETKRILDSLVTDLKDAILERT
jgi:hypothetical protein